MPDPQASGLTTAKCYTTKFDGTIYIVVGYMTRSDDAKFRIGVLTVVP